MRRKRVLTFEQYLFHACNRLHDLGGTVDAALSRATGTEPVVLEARVSFPEHQIDFEIFEVIEKTEEGHAHRTKYRYQCVAGAA